MFIEKYNPRVGISTRFNKLYNDMLRDWDQWTESSTMDDSGNITYRYRGDMFMKGWTKEDDGYRLKLNIPGYGKEDVSISVKNNKKLTIKVGEERHYEYVIVNGYNPNEAHASVDKGVLEIFVPSVDSNEGDEIEIAID